ncbi:MAG TPA: DUF2797 domain-containing protein [Candidatus Saccharimonadia bacterium]
MVTGSNIVCLGIDWSQPDQPALRLAQLGSAGPSWLRPLTGTLGFRIDHSERYCSGWFDLTGPIPRHITCETWEVVTRAKQCRRCQFREGFIGAHQAHNRPNALPANVREYLRQPHHLYVAGYADGSTKIGTAAQARQTVRLAEQGAVAACFIAEAPDGLLIRVAEAFLSTSLGLKQAVPTRRKLEALTSPVDPSAIKYRLEPAAITALQAARDLDSVTCLPVPLWWALPAPATAAFAAAPVALYAYSLEEGEHGLHIQGITGTIAVFTTHSAMDAPVFAADLSALQGHQVELGSFESPLQPVQDSLF